MPGSNVHTNHQIGRRLRLRDLTVFSAVAEHRSMAKAAAALGVKQPTVSEVIADLEHNYSVRLFDRSPRGVELTVYGEALLKRSIAVFDEINQSARDIEFLTDPAVGEIRIASVEGLSSTVLPELLLQFTRLYPRVVFHVDNLTTSESDMSGILKPAVRPGDRAAGRHRRKLTTDDLSIRPLYVDGLVIAAGMNNPWTRRSNVHLADLLDEPWILSPVGYWHRTCVEEAFRAQALRVPKARLVSVAITLRMRLMAAGPYISVFTGSVMKENAHRFGVAALPVELPSKPWPVVIVTSKHRTQSEVVERFIESASQVAKSYARHQSSG